MNPLVAQVVLALVIAVSAATHARAQVRAPLVFEVPASTEALGMGGVFPISGTDSDAIFYNPAALVEARGVGVALQTMGSAGRLANASGALPWLGGGIGVGIQALAYDAAGGASPDAEDLVAEGGMAVSELAASLGYSREVGGVRLGAAVKVLEQRIGPETGTSAAMDVGAVVDAAFLTVGVSVQNLGPDVTVGDLELSMPDRVTLAGSLEPVPLGPLDVRGAARVSRRTDGEIIPAAGVDFRYWPIQGRTFIARVGVGRVPDGDARPVTFGLAFWGDAIAVEYAFRGYHSADDAHRVGVRWRR